MNNEQRTIKPKVVFMGTPDFAATILTTIIRSSLFDVCCVITAPDKPVGRKQILTPSAVQIVAQRYNIKVGHAMSNFLNIKPDLIVLAAYGQILPKEILDIPKYGCLNVHPSLLPKYRGPSPIQSFILSGGKKTGVTIILMDTKIDHGGIVANLKFEIGNSKITYKELHNKLAELGANLLVETIPRWIKRDAKPKPQDEKRATYTKILTREHGRIDWRKSAQEIERQIRAFDPWPGTYTIYKGKILKILKAEAVQNKLIIKQVQLEGKKPMSFEDFLRGHPNFSIQNTE